MKKPRSIEEIGRIREEILEQALDIIIEKGLEALTMRTLAARTGMSAPNLYNYYSSKEELYLSLVVKGFEMLQGDLEAACYGYEDIMQRARSMIRAYLDFGLKRSRYYDIMFSLPTPKYNDYVGTTYEALAATEYRISMDIFQLAASVVSQITGENGDSRILQRRVIQVWSLLHGMISLRHSAVVSYVAEDVDMVYTDIVEELLGIVSPKNTGRRDGEKTASCRRKERVTC